MKISLLSFVFLFLAASLSVAEEPFSIDLHYESEGGMLKVTLERHSRDEVKHFMQRIVIYKDSTTQTEENLISQNHLNKIIKFIPYGASAGDIVKVDLYYGDNEVFHKEYKVTLADQPKKATSKTSTSSILVEDKKTAESKKIPKTIKKEIKKKDEQYGYEMDGHQDYGKEGFGYEGSKEQYGTSINDDDYKNIYGHDPYGYQTKDKQYGYTKDDNKLKGQGVFGHQDSGYRPDTKSYGRDEYTDDE